MVLGDRAWVDRAVTEGRPKNKSKKAPILTRHPFLPDGWRVRMWFNKGMNYVVAVSGGVDSVVLLDTLVKSGEHTLIVAHFDHGIRDDSAGDARFVEGLAEKYGLPFESERVELGVGASEEAARSYRYDFLRRIADRHKARIVTAHHQDDLVETIVINFLRGTGWRGLAVLNDSSIERPLLNTRKAGLYGYAVTNGLEWVEDETNATDAYLRNRVRKSTALLADEVRRELVALRVDQCRLSKEISGEASLLITTDRLFLTMVGESVAMELLREYLKGVELSLTRPRLGRLLLAIKTARAGTTFQAGDGVEAVFTNRDFIVKHP